MSHQSVMQKWGGGRGLSFFDTITPLIFLFFFDFHNRDPSNGYYTALHVCLVFVMIRTKSCYCQCRQKSLTYSENWLNFVRWIQSIFGKRLQSRIMAVHKNKTLENSTKIQQTDITFVPQNPTDNKISEDPVFLFDIFLHFFTFVFIFIFLHISRFIFTLLFFIIVFLKIIFTCIFYF